MPRVIVLDKLAQEGLDILEATPNIEYEVRIGLKGEELRQALSEFDGAVCRSGVKITAESLEGNRRLKAIARAGVGTDNIDKPTATRMGVVVMNTPTGNTLSTAEHAFALMLALSRNIAPANQSLIEGRWDRSKFMGAQLADKTLGVIGLGRIGLEVAKRAQAFQMKVVAYDPFLSAERAKELNVEQAESVEELLPKADYITVHTPKTSEPLVGEKQLKLLKPGVRLINCARGGIYDEAALLKGLEAGQIGGVALDVYAEEPCTDSPLFGKPGVLATPHLGASTEEAQTQVAIEAVNLVINYLTKGEIRHAVNTAAVDPITLEAMRGQIDVAYRLGRLMAGWHDGGLASCDLHYRGEAANKDTKLLTSAFCAGLLEASVEGVNIINAEVLLRERGIKLNEQRHSEMGAFSSAITATLKTDSDSYTAGATLFGATMPRLISLAEYRLEAYLDGILLLFFHTDVPGIIGRVGTLLGKHNVNIAQMSVGRAEHAPGGRAIGVLNLDSLPPQAAIDEMLESDVMHSVKVIELPSAGALPPWM
jgi:D-3-phosphoglycerate dehydrogenase